MKARVCISATGDNLDAVLDPRFGRCQYFLILDKKGKLIKAIQNAGAKAIRGAGVAAAQSAANEKVEAVISGNIGPSALSILSAAKIKVFLGQAGTAVPKAFQEYQKGKLKEAAGQEVFVPGTGFGPRGRNLGGWGRGRKR